MATSCVDQLAEDGFLVMRGEIDPVPISEEMDRVSLDAFRDRDAVTTLAQGSGSVTFRYVPMMSELTPVSLCLLDRFAGVGADLLGRTVLPGRAKGTWYFGDTGWHRDSGHRIPSLGFVAYLEVVHASNGALRVIPGSHRDRSVTLPDGSSGDPSIAGKVIETVPGDVIVFDEHLIHGSTGGQVRRQWRVDFVVDPVDPGEVERVKGWFGQSIPDEQQDCGYDAERYPSYGRHWRTRDRTWTNKLRELGVY